MKIKENQILQGFIDSDQKHLLNFYYKVKKIENGQVTVRELDSTVQTLKQQNSKLIDHVYEIPADKFKNNTIYQLEIKRGNNQQEYLELPVRDGKIILKPWNNQPFEMF